MQCFESASADNRPRDEKTDPIQSDISRSKIGSNQLGLGSRLTLKSQIVPGVCVSAGQPIGVALARSNARLLVKETFYSWISDSFRVIVHGRILESNNHISAVHHHATNKTTQLRFILSDCCKWRCTRSAWCSVVTLLEGGRFEFRDSNHGNP
jgi:hypothetical protein